MSHDPEAHLDAAGLPINDGAAIRSALLELVLLKEMKIRHGESDEYRVRRERAWVEARRALALPETS